MIEVTKGAENEEDCCVCGCIIDGCGDVGDVDTVFGACWNVNLVIAGSYIRGTVRKALQLERKEINSERREDQEHMWRVL